MSNLFLQFQANKPNLAKLDLIAPTLFDKPVIVRDEIKKCLRFEVRVQAKPDAQVAWLKENVALKAGSKYKIDVKKEPDNVFLAILEIYVMSGAAISCDRPFDSVEPLFFKDFAKTDGGIYKMQAKNDAGQLNLLVELNIEQCVSCLQRRSVAHGSLCSLLKATKLSQARRDPKNHQKRQVSPDRM